MRSILSASAVLLLSLSLFAQTAAHKPAPTSKPTAPAALPADAPTTELADQFFKREFGYDPNIKIQVANIAISPIPDIYDITAVFDTPQGPQVSHWFVSKDLKHVIAGDLLLFGADPFASDRAALAKSAFGPTHGPADAKLLIVEFADLECPSCKEAQPLMEKLRTDLPQARFIFQSFPLSQMHPWAVRAASYLDCISRDNQDQAFTFIEAVYTHQKDIEEVVRKTDAAGKTSIDDAAVTERMRHYTEMAGADPAKTQSCAESSATSERITRSELLGQSLGVTGTPTIFINGRRIGNPSAAQYDALKAVADFESDQAANSK